MPSPEAQFSHGYGITEMAPAVTMLDPEHTDEAYASGRMPLIGKSMVCVELRISDEHDAELTHETVRLILARGPNMMLGY